MHPADISAAIRKAGHTNKSIGATVVGRAGRPVSEGAVWNVIHGRSRSDSIARAIAAAIGRAPADLWPALYGAPLLGSRPHYRLRLDGRRELVSVRRC